MRASTLVPIRDYDDADFNPYATFDKMGGFGEVENPFPKLHEMAARGPVQHGDLRIEFGLAPFPFWSHLPSYMVFGHEMVSRVYLDGATFSNEIMRAIYDETFGASINSMDAPEHMRYRRLFQKAFMPGTVAKWGLDLVPRVVDRLINKFVDRGCADLVAEFSSHYPFDIIYEQLALPPEDAVVFQKLAVGLMCVGIDAPHAMEASRKMGVYLEALLEERGASGADDLVGMLARAEVDGERLPADIAVSFLRQLMNAAGDTTYRATGSLFVGLLSNPEQLAAVKNDRRLIPQAVDEALRWDGPLTLITREATRDVELCGVPIAKGAKIDVVQGSANRDAAQFENPDSFNIFRPRKRNVAFAYGAHVCLGQHLARVEMERASNMLLDRLPNLRLDPDFPPPVIAGLNSRAPLALHVRFDP